MCNKEVKFGAFHKYAKDEGADFIATGHYAQVQQKNTEEEGSSFHILRGIDPEKDQSYFLWAISKKVLNMTLFPLGGMQKSAVRALAASFGLPNAQKRDSQGICFLGNVSVEEFLAHEFGTTPGTAYDGEGVKVGGHPGALLSTLGQRIALEDAAPGPWYVIAKDVAQNKLTVAHSPRIPSASSILLQDTNWFTEPKDHYEYTAQYRYHGPALAGTFHSTHQAFVSNNRISEAVASGQSLVLYDGEECVGGGIIS
jgi:tRNA-specific 2-thiouridylase